MNLIPSSSSTSASLALQQALQTPLKARPYSASIMRQNPTAFVFLIDQSGSMGEPTQYRGQTCSKAEAVAQIVNQMFCLIRATMQAIIARQLRYQCAAAYQALA